MEAPDVIRDLNDVTWRSEIERRRRMARKVAATVLGLAWFVGFLCGHWLW